MENQEIPQETQETNEKIGNFKPKRKFLNFVTGIKGRVRLLRKVAFLNAEQLSGMLEGVKFKITICDQGTIDFEEVETTHTNLKMIQRFLDEIDNRDVSGYAEKYIVSGLTFEDEDGKPCYLEVEYAKPIDQLFSIFEEKDNKTISSIGLSLLDSLFSDININETQTSENLEEVNKITESVVVTKKIVDNSNFLEEQFNKMNEDKIQELKDRIEKNNKEYQKTKFEISNSEKKLQKIQEDVSILESRLESFNPKIESNGYVFFVSDEQKPEDIGLTDENRQVADKIADIVGLKKDVLFKMLTEGFYKIQITTKDNISEKEPKVTSEVLSQINSIVTLDKSKDAKITVTGPGIFEYRGTLTWHQIVDKLIKKGFEQDPEFDKICGSNSYESNQETNNNSDKTEQ
jgi:hypothetical protein